MPDTQTCPGQLTFLLHSATDLTMTYSEKKIRSSELMAAEQVHNSRFPSHHPPPTNHLPPQSRKLKIYVSVISLLDK
jgi:hypothetical protein